MKAWLRATLYVTAAVLLLGGGVSVYAMVLAECARSPSDIVQATTLVMVVCFVVLLCRYCLLIWFAFLAHLEPSPAEQPTHEPFISIIAPAFNEGLVLDQAIRSLVRLDYPRYEVIIVDDGSSDDTYQRARAWTRYGGRVPVRALTKPNGGKASALNHGIRHAHGEFILCIDTDSMVAPETPRLAMRHFDDPTVGAVAGNVKIGNRRNLVTWLQALEYIEGLNMMRRAQAFFHLVNVVPGPIGFFRRRAVLEVGGYPEDTFAEDCDLTLLLLQRGWKIRYEPRAVSWTEAPERLEALMKQRYRWTRGQLQAFRKRNRALFTRGLELPTRLTILYMTVDAVLWPAVHIMMHCLFLGVVLMSGATQLLLLWWLQLSMLDFAAALFSLGMEDEDIRLLAVAPIYRVGYVLLLDVAKLMATLEDTFGVEMTWGKLKRLGHLG